MKKIALCWELGGGLGHIKKLKIIANSLIEAGNKVVFIIKDVSYYHFLQTEHEITCLQAPLWASSQCLSISVRNYSELLLSIGYQDHLTISKQVGKWLAIFQQHNFDLIVADHAPTARLSAYIAHLPHIAIGTGFCCPPNSSPFPAFDTGQLVDENELTKSDSTLCASINKVLAVYNKTLINQPQNILCSNKDILYTLPHLDHYQRPSNDQYWGPIFNEDAGQQVTWKNNNKKKVFCYLKTSFASLPAFAQALNTIEADKIIYLAGDTNQTRENIFSPDTQVINQPVNMQCIFHGADLIISHAGHNLVSQALMTGNICLLIPLNKEQSILANKLTRHGLVSACFEGMTSDEYKNKIVQIVSDEQLKKNCHTFAQHYHGFDPQEQIQAMCDTIIEYAD